MPDDKKVSVRTPPQVYQKLMQRAFELNLSNREYYLALAMQDLGIEGEGEELTEEMATKLKSRLKELDDKNRKEK